MKTYLIITLLFITSICSGYPRLINNTNKHNDLFNDVLKSIAPELGLDTTNVEIIITEARFNEQIYAQQQGVNKAHASINCIGSVFVINIKVNTVKNDIIKAFIHELVHVSQCVHKRLIIRKTYIIFDGEIITNNTPFEDRLYETEARYITFNLFKKYKNTN